MSLHYLHNYAIDLSVVKINNALGREDDAMVVLTKASMLNQRISLRT